MNLFENLPVSPLKEELFETLLQKPGLKIERIVSTGQASPAGFWYDQPEDEWVALLQGEAVLRFVDSPDPVRLRAGDTLLIPAHRKHRVEETLNNGITVWLAIYCLLQT